MWNLIRKDLIRRWRAPASTLAMLLFPLFMSGMIGLISGGGDEQEFPVVKVFLEDRDDSWLTRILKGGLGRDEARKRLDVVEVGPEGRARMEKGEASALLVIPAAFTDSLLAGRPVTLEVVRNPAEGIAPEIVEQGVLALSTYLDQAQKLLGGQLQELRRLTDFDRVPPSGEVGRLAESFNDKMRSFERYLFPPVLKVAGEKEKEPEAKSANRGSSGVYGYVLIMTTIMALLFVTARAVGDLFDERKCGMLRRTLASPADVRLIVAAKYAAGVAMGLVVSAILAGLGFAFRWLRPPIDPLGCVLLIALFSLAGCGLMGLVFAVVRTERQAGVLSWLVVMGNSALGGSMVPMENMPPPMRAMSPFTLNYWAIDGFKELVFNGAHAGGIARHLLVLGLAAVALALAGWALMVRRSREVPA